MVGVKNAVPGIVFMNTKKFIRGQDPVNETCLGCGKHIRYHYGGTEYRCYPECAHIFRRVPKSPYVVECELCGEVEEPENTSWTLGLIIKCPSCGSNPDVDCYCKP